ncbi:hypothetical protein G6F35_015591 [Rhizopus arrhizus]|nr:hypothetical protein G6F35_015591 [Rhizopus arrhizus]
MLSITVAGAGGKSLGGAGAIGVNLSRADVSAIIDNTGAAAGTKVLAEAGAVSVSAQDASRIVTATGALGLSLTQGASAAIGASVSVADMRNDVRAAIAGATVTAESVQVRAEERASIYNVSVGLAGGAGVAVSGSVAVNTIQNTVHAQIRDASHCGTGGQCVRLRGRPRGGRHGLCRQPDFRHGVRGRGALVLVGGGRHRGAVHVCQAR